jgi:hypothetical protein
MFAGTVIFTVSKQVGNPAEEKVTFGMRLLTVVAFSSCRA